MEPRTVAAKELLVLRPDFVAHGIHLFGGLQRLMQGLCRFGLVLSGNNKHVVGRGAIFAPAADGQGSLLPGRAAPLVILGGKGWEDGGSVAARCLCWSFGSCMRQKNKREVVQVGHSDERASELPRWLHEYYFYWNRSAL